MTGTTIDTSGTVGIQITLDIQNPLLITEKGTIDTTGAYAILESTPSPGKVINRGVLKATAATGIGIDMSGDGTVRNFELISGGAEGVYVAVSGKVRNFGSIVATGTGGVGVELHGGGTVINGTRTMPGGTITGAADGVLMVTGSGTVDNHGTITGTGKNGVEIDNGFGGSSAVVNGFGKLSHWLIAGAVNAVQIGNGSVTNYGTLIGTTGAGVSIANGGNVANGDATDLGRLIRGAAWGVDIGGAGSVTNFGSIVATGTSSIGVQIAGGGTVINGSAKVTGRMITGGMDGVLMNNGAGTVDNFGTITGTSNNGVEIDNGLGGSSTVVNGGTGSLSAYLITGAVNAVRIGNGSVTNYGTLIGTTGAGVSIANGGNVANGDATDLGRLIRGAAWGVDIGGAGSVTNFGSIVATGTSSIGVQIAGGGTVINGSAVVTGRMITGGMDGVLMNNGAGTVDNFGTITGTSNNGVEIDNGLGGTSTVVNGAGALITGKIGVVTGGPATLTNAGTIIGTGGTAVQFGNSNDRLILDAGAKFVGVVNGGGGSNTLELAAGTGKTGSIGTSFINFGSLAVDAGAIWTLTGSNAIATVTNDGTLKLAASASLDISASIDPASLGLFSLDAGATLEIGADTGSQDRISFLASADLAIDHAAQFGSQVGTTSYAGPTIDKFIAGDSIDLKDVAAGVTLDYSSGSGLLQITSGSTAVATLQFQTASLGAGSFHVGNDGSGHALITHS